MGVGGGGVGGAETQERRGQKVYGRQGKGGRGRERGVIGKKITHASLKALK